MSARPFQCTPAAWNRDPILNSVSWEAEFLFRRISLECDRYWRMAVDGAEIAHSVRCRALEPSRRYQAWTLPKVARALDELMAAGIVRRLVQAERCWLEVAAWLQYVKGSGADIVPERADQVDLLPLLGGTGPELFVVGRDPPSLKLRRMTPPDEASHSNERTSREDENRTSTRARGASDAETELFDSLSMILGPAEMVRNGGMWRDRLRKGAESVRAIRNTIEDYKMRTPDKGSINNRGAWATDRYERNLMEIMDGKRARRTH